MTERSLQRTRRAFLSRLSALLAGILGFGARDPLEAETKQESDIFSATPKETPCASCVDCTARFCRYKSVLLLLFAGLSVSTRVANGQLVGIGEHELTIGALQQILDDAPEAAAGNRAAARAFAQARKTAANREMPITKRVAAVRVLGREPGSETEDLRILAGLLVPESPLDVQLAAVDTLAQLPYERTTEVLLSNWPKHGPRVHTAVVSVLLWRDPWLGALHDEVEQRPELAAALEWARRDIVLRHSSAAIRAQAEKLLETPTPRLEIQHALDKFQPSLSMQGDPVRGKSMFQEATCANCHKLDGVGRDIGSDLSRLIDKSRQSLLIHTIDPNRVVPHRFLEYTVLTQQGRVFSGMLLDESQDSITLADVNGEATILRADVDELISNRRSQMPEHLEVNLSLQQMADLLAFIAASSSNTDSPRTMQDER